MKNRGWDLYVEQAQDCTLCYNLELPIDINKNIILVTFFRAVRGGDPRCHRRGGLEAREGGRDPDRRGPRRRRGQGEERAAGATPPLRHEWIRKGQLSWDAMQRCARKCS